MKVRHNGAAVGRESIEEAVHVSRRHAEKHREREAKVRRQADRPPPPMQRFRIIMEAIEEGRRVIDLADHRARYALVALGVLNAGAFLLISRAHFLGSVAPAARNWMVVLLLIYAALNLLFVLHAIDCLRPRRLSRALPPGRVIRGEQSLPMHEPMGLLFWEAVSRVDLPTYRQAWDHVVMGQVNAEAEAVFHTMARVIQAKYRALGRLYVGLAGLVVLAFVILLSFTIIAVVSN
jgi:hypothetical protein